MAAELEVIIGANTKGIEDGSDRAEKAINDVTVSIEKLKSSITQQRSINRGYASAIKDITKAYDEGNMSQKQYSIAIQRIERDEKEALIETVRLTNQLKQLNSEQKQLQTNAKNAAAALNKAAQSTENIQMAANNGAGAMNTLGKATSANAVPALTSFSQVMQDAPYGIQGVANNIQQLTMQFGYLQKSAGGTIPALKLMLSSLAGPAGILLAVSLVTTLLITFGDELFGSGKAAKTAAEELEEYVDSLKGVQRAQLDASVSAAKELVQLRLLSQQATNTALSTKERVAAVNELRKMYPEYLKGMTNEQILANGLTTAYDNITNSIMRKARAQAASNIMVKNMEEEIALSNQLAGVEGKLEKARLKAAESLKKSNRENTMMTGVNASKAQRELNELVEEQLNLQGQIQSRQLENINLTESIKASGDLIVTPENVTIAGEMKDGVRIPVIPVMGEMNMSGTTNGMIEWQKMLQEELAWLKNTQAQIPLTAKEYDLYAEKIANVENRLKGMTDTLALSGQAGAEQFALLAESMEPLKEKFNEVDEAANIFASSVGGAISELGGVLQEKFAEGGKAFEIFGGLIINTMTKIISQALQQLISEKLIAAATKKVEYGKSAAKGVTIATNAAAAAGPVGIGLLPGFLASTQAMIAATFAGISGFNFGGFVGDNHLVRMNGNERILTAAEANTFNNLMTGRNVAMGGQSINVNISGQFVQRGNDLVATVNQTQQVQSRRG